MTVFITLVLVLYVVNSLDIYQSMRYTIEMTRQVIYDLVPTTILLLAIVLGYSLIHYEFSRYDMEQGIPGAVPYSFFYSFKIQWLVIYTDYPESLQEFYFSKWLFTMVSTYTFPLLIANIIISVISNTFGRVNPIQEILDMRVTCDLCLHLEYISFGTFFLG